MREKIITYSNLRNYAYSNDKICKKPIRGIVLDFPGLNFKDMYEDDSDMAHFYAQKAIIYIVPYMNPWAWMNKQTVTFIDDLIEVLCEEYELDKNIPIVSSGGSMGGQQALVYMAYAKLTPIACVVNCPVCDLSYHFTERADVPRTIYSAFGGYEQPLAEAIQTASPIHIANKLPNANYYIFHCEEDKAVNIHSHSIPFVNKIKEDYNVVLHKVPQKGHCHLTQEMSDLYSKYIVENIYNF